MYGLILAGMFVCILIFKTKLLQKNKRSNGDFEDIDEELVIMLTEGNIFD